MIYAAAAGAGAAILIWRLLRPPPAKLCGTPGGPPVTSPRVKLSSGRHISYRQLGVPMDEAKFKVVIVHGFDSSKDLHIPLSQEFMETLGVHIVAIDRSGYGESDPNPNRTIKSETLDLQEFADQLQLGSTFHLIGLSMGNYVSWGCLKYIPHRLAGVALVVPAANCWWPSLPAEISGELFGPLRRKDKWTLRVAHHAPALLNWWVKIFPKFSLIDKDLSILSDRDFETVKKISQVPNPNEHKVRQQGEADSLYKDLKIGFGSWEFDPLELGDPFPESEGRVHIWQGYEDRLVPFKLQRYVANKLPWIKYHEVPDGGHLIIHDDVFCQLIFKSLLLGEEPSFK